MRKKVGKVFAGSILGTAIATSSVYASNTFNIQNHVEFTLLNQQFANQTDGLNNARPLYNPDLHKLSSGITQNNGSTQSEPITKQHHSSSVPHFNVPTSGNHQENGTDDPANRRKTVNKIPVYDKHAAGIQKPVISDKSASILAHHPAQRNSIEKEKQTAGKYRENKGSMTVNNRSQIDGKKTNSLFEEEEGNGVLGLTYQASALKGLLFYTVGISFSKEALKLGVELFNGGREEIGKYYAEVPVNGLWGKVKGGFMNKIILPARNLLYKSLIMGFPLAAKYSGLGFKEKAKYEK
ncbi:hypothetical protein SAMN05443252_101443 [Bacillus sp. OV322]|uniref:hypothetical protein n=1 Tax=Bacillus sp. OV322 TaxID=1882764 RepID=UPI0008E5ECAB|nr:hypothetical protein [Bacillus sp. OV322]SFC01241.1 hypothetical protein SAMN05443252_101443 [Bacillus sp. OV322]